MWSVTVDQIDNDNQLVSNSQLWYIDFIAGKSYVVRCHNEYRCMPFFFIVQGLQERCATQFRHSTLNLKNSHEHKKIVEMDDAIQSGKHSREGDFGKCIMNVVDSCVSMT